MRLLVASLAFAVGLAGRPSKAWRDGKFKTMVTFGDSFTDETRLTYFLNNNGSAPPVGWDEPLVNSPYLLSLSFFRRGLATASGGLSWARYASIYSQVELYNYAVYGACCDNNISPLYYAALNGPYPDITSYELPAFIADSKYTSPDGKKFFTGQPDSTVYAIWIGTNDLGNDAFLTDSQVPGKTVKDYIDCVYNTIGKLYANGARYFVILNLAPLNLAPQYATPENGGKDGVPFFPANGRNVTATSYRMMETVTSLNQVYKYRTPFAAAVSDKYPGARMANFDVHALMTDIWQNPSNYLNGSAPLNVTGHSQQCSDVLGLNCTLSDSPDSYMWFDPLHPSEQTSRIVAREFVGVLGGKSKWAEYWA
ncbi:GDSL lipase/esterase [Pyrenochaeta sp. MPI-SDFR-AT-0127]|nr:GDSL lipase/esterase [Pyrenochaeta sp. MPI-SDFR-AT-0127]